MSGSLHGREEKQVRLSMCGGVMALRTTSRRTRTLTPPPMSPGYRRTCVSVAHDTAEEGESAVDAEDQRGTSRPATLSQ